MPTCNPLNGMTQITKARAKTCFYRDFKSPFNKSPFTKQFFDFKVLYEDCSHQGAAPLKTSSKMTIWWRHNLSLWCKELPLFMFGNAMASLWWRLITVLSDDDDDSILTVGDKMSSFGFLDDDEVMHHQKKWRRHDDLAVTVNDARPLVHMTKSRWPKIV